MKKILFLLSTFYFSLSTVIAQDQLTIDSLLNILKTAPNDTNKVNLLFAIGDEYEAKQPMSAVSYYKLALKVTQQIKSPLYEADCYEYLGIVYEVGLAKFDSAEVYYLDCIKIRKEVLGEKHPEYAVSLNNLAGLYSVMGNYTAAEPLFLVAKKIRKDVFGEKHADYATSLNNLAVLYFEMGNYATAELLFIEAMNIRKDVLGEKHPRFAQSLNNLATLYYTIGNYATAEHLCIETKNICKEVLGEKHPDYALSLNNLALIYIKMSNYSAAEPLFLEATEIWKEVLGEKHPDYAMSLNNLALLYLMMGNYSAAEHFYIKANNICKEMLGEKHPNYAASLINIANLYNAMGDNEKAEQYYIESLNIIHINTKQNFGFLSEKEKENYLKTLSGNFNQFSAFAFKRFKENPFISQNLYNITLATKGLLLNSSNRIRDDINNTSDTVLIHQYKKWQVLKEDIGRYSQMDKAKLKKLNVNLDSLESIANTMEKQISLKSNVFVNDKKNNEIKWNQVKEKLNDKDAAIEFITYQPLNLKNTTKKSDTTMYCALILRKEDKYPQMLSLCNNFELAALLGKTELYQTTSEIKGVKPIVNSYVDDINESQLLYGLLWKPLDSLLSGKEKIYVSLTGLMNKISMNALQDAKKQILLNKYNLCFVNSTRQLAMEEIVKPEANQIIALFGGINYETDTTEVKKTNSNEILASRGLSSDTASGSSWNFLSGTLSEVTNINKVFSKSKWKTKVYTGNDGTEENFKLLTGKNSPTILHISTHGFFFPEPDSTTYKTTRNPFKTMLNPLWRSGIILAGANNSWQCRPAISGKEDGVLTAYEVANTNLRNTDLVVLSACETGLGDIKTGEGVYGLQRAFQVAGAKAVIMSLWSVPDKETTELMTLFYESYIKTKNKHDSFRMAQQTLAKKYAPYYWAAFMLVE